eukprot:gene424-1823_t
MITQAHNHTSKTRSGGYVRSHHLGKCDDEVGRSGIYDEYECVRAIDITQYSLSSGPFEGGSSVVDGCSVRSYDGLALSLLPSFLNPKG